MPTILLVDDEDQIAQILTIYLEGHGHHVIIAGGVEDALAKADAYAGPIDLLITDLRLQAAAGAELAQQLLARRPGMKIVYLSGSDWREIEKEIPAGAAYLQKPFALPDLLVKMEEALADKGKAPDPE
jgi:DNA-binding NtrC family response regulator